MCVIPRRTYRAIEVTRTQRHHWANARTAMHFNHSHSGRKSNQAKEKASSWLTQSHRWRSLIGSCLSNRTRYSRGMRCQAEHAKHNARYRSAVVRKMAKMTSAFQITSCLFSRSCLSPFRESLSRTGGGSKSITLIEGRIRVGTCGQQIGLWLSECLGAVLFLVLVV